MPISEMRGQITWWSIAFFFAANAAGSAYLTTSEIFPQQIRASAIAIFYGFGTLFAGVLGPTIFDALLTRAEPWRKPRAGPNLALRYSDPPELVFPRYPFQAEG